MANGFARTRNRSYGGAFWYFQPTRESNQDIRNDVEEAVWSYAKGLAGDATPAVTYVKQTRFPAGCTLRENTCASIPTSIPVRKQFHCDLQTKPCKSQNDRVDHHNHQHGCNHLQFAIYTPFSKEDASGTLDRSRARRADKVPTATLDALREKTYT